MQFHSRSLKILYMFLYIVSYYKLNILSKKKKGANQQVYATICVFKRRNIDKYP